MSIEVRRISKRFGPFRALNDVSVTIPDGKLVALLGPSGSGKSTLLRIIAGLEQTDPHPQADVSLAGKSVTADGVAERGIGFVFQHYALFKHMTVFENIAFGLRVRPKPTRPTNSDIRQRVNELLKLMQIEGLEKRRPAELSGGQRQRVALARALAPQPKVLLLDEPFGALDAKVRQDLRRWLRKLHDEIHVTSVFVTHDQEEALELADRIVVMNKGRIEQEGTPEDVFHNPATPFVAEFLGNVNLFHARIDAAGQAVFGTFKVDNHNGAISGSAARVYIRPHEIDLSTQPIGPQCIRATITRIRSAGPIVKVELTDPDSNPFEVELTHSRLEQLALTPGDHVFAAPRVAKVFTSEDYAI